MKTLAIDPNHRITVQIGGKLTCLCPVNGRRDYATVEVVYSPTGNVVELESFADHLSRYAMSSMSHEAITEDIATMLHDILIPDDLTVRTRWDAVEGVDCVVVASR